jgi:hypothetical protein
MVTGNYFLSYSVIQYYQKHTRAAQNTMAIRVLRTPAVMHKPRKMISYTVYIHTKMRV